MIPLIAGILGRKVAGKVIKAGVKRAIKSPVGQALKKKAAPMIEDALDRKYRIQDAYDFAQRAAKNIKK